MNTISSEDIEKVIKKTEAMCASTGVKLTDKRKKVLIVLLSSDIPLSAYEITEHYKDRFHQSIPAMSVYRMLNFLMEENLVHKLALTNKYVACSHIICQHDHEVPQFLICESCHSVYEISIKKETVDELVKNVKSIGFLLKSQQLELHGICEKCQ